MALASRAMIAYFRGPVGAVANGNWVPSKRSEFDLAKTGQFQSTIDIPNPESTLSLCPVVLLMSAKLTSHVPSHSGRGFRLLAE